MTRILLRSPKSPFVVVSPQEALEANLIGDNSGNLVFLHAAHKLLATRGTQVDEGGFSVDPSRADEVNETYDAYVLPLANAFRLTYQSNLERITAFIEGLKIPVIVLGVGAQADLDYDLERLLPIESTVKRFVTAVLNRAPSIGVRGELTEHYLRSLGFRDVEVIGCPSMYLHGPRLPVEKARRSLGRRSRIAVSSPPYVAEMGPILANTLKRYPNLSYVGQDLATLEVLVELGDAPIDDPAQRLFAARKVRFYVEPWPWISDLAGFDFAFGARIHGNITALLAGTPAYVLAHDSRTLELARYHAIPHRSIPDVAPDVDVADLYAEADYGPMLSGHAARFATFSDYLHRHGLRHVYDEGEDPTAFDARIAATRFPGALGVSRLRRTLRREEERMDRIGRRASDLATRARRWRRRVRRRLTRS